MYSANREHKATLSRMEQKFFEEKVNNFVCRYSRTSVAQTLMAC